MPAKSLTVELQPKQRRLLRLVDESPATWIGYGGSRGGAKSYGIDAVMLIRRMKYAATSGCIMRRTFDLVRENHIDRMTECWPWLAQYWRASDKEFQLPNRSKIAFRYAENPGDVKLMIGKQYMDIFVDQAEQFSEDELTTIKSCVRWPALPEGVKPKLALSFNPGDQGAAFLKRIFYDHDYRGKERPGDYEFIQAYGWDNIVWGMDILKKRHITPYEYYYKWNSDQRFQFFIEETDYGRDLDAKPKALRLAWLLGSFDKFVGQYFDCWNEEFHVKHIPPAAHGTIWLGLDWGFGHDAAALWCSQIERRMTSVYREHVESGASPRLLAMKIVEMTPEAERPRLRAIYMSHDAFGKKDERDTVAIQMGQVFRAAGLPWPIQATRDTGDRDGHYGGPALVYDMLKARELFISPYCEKLIKTIPMVSRDEVKREKTVSFEGDDSYDALVYALKDRLSPAAKPAELVVQEQAEAIKNPEARFYFLLRHALEGPQKKSFGVAIPSMWGGTY